MTRWEYTTLMFKPGGFTGGKTDPEEIERELNALGNLGWEVTGVIETAGSGGVSRDIVVLLKRPKE